MAGIGECSICTEPLDNNLATIPCGHIFHIECVKKCIQNFKKCPKCRRSCKLDEIIQLFAENSLSTSDNDVSSEFKDLFIQLNKVAETNNQSLKRVLSQLQQKEKECEALKKELLEEKTLREATEHALALEKSKNKTVLTPPKTMSHEREVLKKPELPPKPIKIQQNPSSTNGISKQANEKNLQRFSPLPTRLNVVRPIVRPTVRKFVRPNVIYVHRSTSPLVSPAFFV
uniref:RING-type domain-containing protein n=1 Tax=Acrobeloides nanus TaxID=290746 RepID=A0A914EJ10_9BILA